MFSDEVNDYCYEGHELQIFAHAKNWKQYYARHLAPHICGDVLEVGAGIGATTNVLRRMDHESWTCLEPDPQLADAIGKPNGQAGLSITPEVVVGTLNDLAADRKFDTVLYIDVMEHIEDDSEEMAAAEDRLNPGGKLVVLCPAHAFLFSEFDRQIGHFRRYNKKMFAALTPAKLHLVDLFYLDSCGMLLSAANRLLLRSSSPTVGQIRTWDRVFVPISRICDRLLFRRVGRSVIGVWER